MKRGMTLTLTVAATLFSCRPAPAGDGSGDTSELSKTLLSTVEAEGAAPSATELRPPLAPPPPAQTVDLDTLGFDRGDGAALVRVIEMSDYGCGFCRQFHQETWPVLRAKFIDSGKVAWKFLPFVTGTFENSPHATVAAECALEQGPGQFESMNARLWNDQPSWKGSPDPAPLLRGWAAEQGLDMARYESCVVEGRRQTRISAASALTRQVGVRGTPTFFVVGYPPLQGALPTETFRQFLDLVYEDALRKAGGGR